jgi:hypothetical protein
MGSEEKNPNFSFGIVLKTKNPFPKERILKQRCIVDD